MREFRTLLNCFKNISTTIESIKTLHQNGDLRSERLIALVTTKSESEHGLLPEGILEAIGEFD